MAGVYYDGWTHELASGTTIRHEADEATIVLEVEREDHKTVVALLTTDEAQKLATSLLRDVALLRYGFG